MTLSEGDRLGAYEVLALIGAGGMGEVYRARDPRLNREVAIKVLPEGLASDATAHARFEREARAVAALSHPNILDIHDMGAAGGVSWVVTELLEGETLSRRLAAGALPWRKAAEIARAIAEGLAAAHARGVVHRDIKPSNVFLTTDGRVKILDFGIATFEERARAPAQPAEDLTDSHSLVGTVGYLSPEQIRKKPVDGRSDVFSLGCVIYEMVTGRRAFPAETAPDAIVATLRSEPADPADLVPGIPEDLRLLILRCLEKNPERRFQSAGDLAFALKVALTGPDAARHSNPSTTLVTTPVSPSHSGRLSTRAVGGLAVVATVVVGAIAAGLFHARTLRAGFGSVAVLPFANATGVADDDYLSEGITESLINSVSRVPGIRVLARTTVYKFREEPDPRKAGRDLSVDAVVTGRVRRQGQDLVVQAELVRVSDGAQIWGDRVTERVSDAAPAAADLAQRIARSLQPRLAGGGEKSLEDRPHDAQAWDLTLRGRYFLNRRRDEDIGRSLDLFQQALARDPNEAAAWLGLADVFNLLGYYGVKAPKDVVPKQREAAARAIALDPALSGAHSSLADVRYEYESDFPGAEREFRRALALNPNDAQAHQWYSNFLSASGRFEESLVEIRKAFELDPLNVTINLDVGLAFYWAGDPARALPELSRALELDPTSPLGHLYMGLILLRTGSRESAIAEWAKAVELSDRSPDALAFWGYGCGRIGRTAEAEAALKELEGLARKRFVSALPFAILTLGLDRKAEALVWLEKAYEERAGRLVYLNVEHGFDPLRAEPRFREIVRKMGLPPVR